MKIIKRFWQSMLILAVMVLVGYLNGASIWQIAFGLAMFFTGSYLIISRYPVKKGTNVKS